MDSWIILLELIANKNLGARMYYTDIGTLSKDRNRLLEIFYMSIDYEEIRSYDCLDLEKKYLKQRGVGKLSGMNFKLKSRTRKTESQNFQTLV